MGDERGDGRLSETEALLWALGDDDPALRPEMVILAVLASSPGIGPLRRRVERLSRTLPRFRHRVEPGPVPGAPPRWALDETFDLAFHVRHVALGVGAGGAGEATDDIPASLLAWLEPVAAEGLERSRPPWQMVLVDGVPGGRAAIVVRFHHAFTDGLGAVEIAAHLFDLVADPPPEPGLAAPLRPTPAPGLADELRREAGRSAALVGRAVPLLGRALGSLLGDPDAMAADALRAARSLAHVGTPSVGARSPVMTARSTGVRLAVIDVALADVRAVAAATGGTVNDVYLAGLLAGLRRYHDRHGSTPADLRVGIPISTRAAGDTSLRNQFVPVRVLAPLQLLDTTARIAALGALVRAERSQPSLGAGEAVATALNRLPPTRRLLAASLASVDVVASNVPGSEVPLYLRGARVTALCGFGPRSAAALNATVLSYDGRLRIACNIDPAAVPDGDRLVASLRDGLAETLGPAGAAAAGVGGATGS